MVYSDAVCILITWKEPGRVNSAPSQYSVVFRELGRQWEAVHCGQLFHQSTVLPSLGLVPRSLSFQCLTFVQPVQPPGPSPPAVDFQELTGAASLERSQAGALEGNRG